MSNWTDALTVVEKLAPTLASVVGGPLAGSGVAALEGVFGLTPEASATPDSRTAALAEAISGATPDQLAAMKKADNDYAVAMASLGFKDKESLAGLQVQDVQGARTMQESTKSYIVPCMAIFVTAGFFGLLASMVFAAIPAANKDLLNVMIGTLGTAWVGMMHFYYGGAMANFETNKLLANSTPIVNQ